MLKERLYRYLIIILIVLGCILRLTVFWVSPVNNSYDDHLEVIDTYEKNIKRPAPFDCWECYQPPLYYYAGAATLRISKTLGADKLTSWKVVQAINPILSIILLIVTWQILMLFKIPKLAVAITLSFIITLPSDIFTSAMIGNDYMLVFFAILTFYLFLKTIYALKSGDYFWRWFILMVLAATLGSLTKQHGLLIHLFPIAVLFLLIIKYHRRKLHWSIPIYSLGLLISLSEEAWKFSYTGKFLVSNQHYFNYAKDQFPGSIEKIEFFTFRILDLYKEPFISERTSASFFTELFARTFYDYEWRFISPKIPWANTLGYIGYSLGVVWLLFLSRIIFSSLKQFYRKVKILDWYAITSQFAPILLGLLFALVPFIQTLRYPYFSSMKAMFMLSGILLLLITLGSHIKQDSFTQKIGILMIVLNITYGIMLVVSISIYLGMSLNHLHGPLWKIP